MDNRTNQLRRKMFAQSFEPHQWWDDGDWPQDCTSENRTMYVYKQTERGLYTVGYYTPHKEWVTDSDHTTQDSAAERVHWLNGGSRSSGDGSR